MKVKSLSHVRLFATLWTVAYQASQSMGFSRQGYWSGLPFPSPGDFPNPGIEPRSPALRADALPSEPSGKVVFNSLWPHELQHTRLIGSSLSLWVCSDSWPLSQWCLPNISFSVTLFSSCPFPVSRSFQCAGSSHQMANCSYSHL